MTKLAIVEEREEDKYERVVFLRWYGTAQEPVQISPADTTAIMAAEPRVKALVDGVMHSLSSARQDEVKAWEEELHPCEHTLTLSQSATGHIPPSGTCLSAPFLPHRLLGGHRTGTLLEMRPQGESLALPYLWCAGLWSQAICRRGWERSRACAL